MLMPKVRLITGSASSLGRHIAEAVLASGDRSSQRTAIRNVSPICSGLI
jgi:NAD(P)-dependent dehydrogenase (short-subunit alcohol dehydrogenase family)